MNISTENGAPTNPQPVSKILIVDDEDILLRLWQRTLTVEGFEVATAGSAEEAMQKIKKETFTVIFSDMSLPGLAGKDLLKHVKQNHVPSCVNIMTGMATMEGAVECIRLGACDYIAKPCRVNEVVAMAKRCLGHEEQRREMLRLRQSITEYQALDKLKSEFVSNVSHELRTPLFAMGAALDLVFEGMDEQMKGSNMKLQEVIKNNYERLSQVIRNVLNFSQMERGTFTPKFQEMDLAVVAQQSLDALTPLFQKNGIHCEPLDLKTSDTKLTADPEQIRQILVNFLGNAVKFTPPEGKVGVEIADDAGNIRLCVRDTGQGIAPEHHEKIFDRFYQVDASITRNAGGCGIGLGIVKKIVELHNGRVWVESTIDQGSRFFVSLPRHRSDEGGSNVPR
jgi:K+-sensing histidine kinase KdpD